MRPTRKQSDGTHQYLRSGWGIKTDCVFKEFPFKTLGGDVLTRGELDPTTITDLAEVDLRGGVGRVALRSPDGHDGKRHQGGSFSAPGMEVDTWQI